MKKTVLTFGILAGGLIFAYTYVFVLILGDFSKLTPDQLSTAEWLGFLRYLLLLLGIAMAMHTYRKNTPGPISYGRIFKVGLLVSLVIAFFVGMMEFIYVAFTNPDFYNQYTTVAIEALRQKGASAAEIEAKRQEIASLSWITPPPMTGLFYFVETSVIGTILSLITALFMWRKEGAASPEGTMINQPV